MVFRHRFVFYEREVDYEDKSNPYCSTDSSIWAESASADVKPARCEMCHNGSVAAKLDSLTSQQISDKLTGYKSGKIDGNIMPSQASKLSEEDIKGYALHFGKPLPESKASKKK